MSNKGLQIMSWLVVVALLATLLPTAAFATPLAQEVICAEEYTIQKDDWLSKLADKYLQDKLAYPQIVDATNKKSAIDATFAEITDPDRIEIGWKVCIPAAPESQMQSVMPRRGGPGGPSTFTSVAPTYQDLAYADISAAQKLDLYIPATGSEPFPVIIVVHGGGFMFGDKADGMGLTGVDQLLAAGYAVASINYRLSSEATYPAQIFDAKAAVRFLRANAASYQLDPHKFGAWGASAGGNLVSLLGTTCGVAELEGAELGNADQSSCVQAVVDWFGPIDFLKMDEQFAGTACPQNHNAADSPESKLVGAALQTVPDIVQPTNPMNYITADDAPFFIENGTADCNIPPIQNQNLADALSAVIGTDKVTYVSLEGAGHGGAQFETAENVQLVISFWDKYLK